MFGELDEAAIDHLFQEQFIGRIGCHADGTTYVVPIGYAYENGCVVGHTREGLKMQMIRKNPRVCFQVDHMGDTSSWSSAIGWGNFEEITKPEERKQVLSTLLNRKLPSVASQTMKLAPQWPFFDANPEDIGGILFRIRLDKKTGRFERFDGGWQGR